MVTPRISVVIPTRNRADCLRAWLEAVLAQTDALSDEVIVADDGSDLGVDELVEEFPSVTWLRL